MSFQNKNGSYKSPQHDYAIDLRVVYYALMRRWKLIAGISLLCLVLGVLFISLQVPRYTASVVLQVNVQEQTMVNMEAQSQMRQQSDVAATNSELEVIASRTVAKRVIDKLNLAEDAEFNPDVEGNLPPLRRLKLYVKELMGAGTAEHSEEIILIHVTNNVLDGLKVSADARSNIVTVHYASENPRKAQLIANTFAEEYLNYQIESRVDSTQRASVWLTENVDALRNKVLESEKAVQEFSMQHNLFLMDGKTTSDQHMEQLNAQMIAEETALAQIRARLERMKGLRNSEGINSIPEVLNSTLIQNLRAQEALLLKQKSELTSQFGPKHPKMNFIDAQINELQAKINDEISKIAKAMQYELDTAQQRVNLLKERTTNQYSKLSQSKALEVQLEELRREADANAQLYKVMLSGMKETNEAGNMKQMNARIISKADLPLEPSHPRKLLILLVSLVFGLALGNGLVLLMEFLNQGFMTLDAVENNTGLAGIAMVPEMSRKQILSDYALHHPSSVYAESLRVIVANLQTGLPDTRAKTVMLISSVPEEGKGWLATSLARVVAKSNKKVLLLDCDLQRTLALHPLGRPVKTLNDYLAGKAQLEEIIQPDDVSGMHYIGSSPDNRNIQELLDAAKMHELMERARESYDLIIMDSPPVLSMADVLFLSRFADAALLAVRWLRTPRRMVENALRALSRGKVNVIGTVLTRVEYGYYKKQMGKHVFRKGFDENLPVNRSEV